MSGIVQEGGSSAASGASVGDVGPVVVTAPSGSASGEGTPDATVPPTDSSPSEAESGAADEAQDDSSTGEAQAIDGGVTCAPVQDSTYFVDPSAGVDEAASTGAANCPFRSLTYTLSIIGLDAGTGATIEIVNETVAPVLSSSTGEAFPIQPPANVTILAEDTTKNLPTVQMPPSQPAPGPTAVPSSYAVFALTNPNCTVSHLIVDGSHLKWIQGFDIESEGGSIDHVTIQNTNRGISALNTGPAQMLDSGVVASGFFTVGPGVLVRNNSDSGVFLLGSSALHIQGGRGTDHTSFSRNGGAGIVVRASCSVIIEGTDIDPSRPDESDVDTDNNVGAGLVVGQYGFTYEEANVVRGLHSSGNTNGIEVLPCARLKLRASYLANNIQSGVYVANGLLAGGICVPPRYGPARSVDLGDPLGPDYGRNIFQASGANAASNAKGSVCLQTMPFGVQVWPTVLAAGNIFANTDCAVGGTLTRSVTCSAQVDIGGLSPDGGAAIDLSNCQ